MTKLFTKIQTRLMAKRDEEGVTIIEYALLAALIAIAAIVAIKAVGGDVSSSFSKVDSAISN
jgi:pilus assembly protein Flp/PilA